MPGNSVPGVLFLACLSMDGVVWCFFCDLDVMRMGFNQSGTGHLDELRLFAKLLQIAGTDITHTGTDTAEQLEDDIAG